jgi:hypothetical protein
MFDSPEKTHLGAAGSSCEESVFDDHTEYRNPEKHTTQHNNDNDNDNNSDSDKSIRPHYEIDI